MSRICLLDLSAAFDTIDHNILITCLFSWFDLHGSVLNWFKSYLSSRSFHVKWENELSSLHTSSCGVHRGSVLGPLLYYVYYSSQFSHLLPLPEPSVLCWWYSTFPFMHLTLTHLTYRIRSADLFFDDRNSTINSSKTELLLIGLKNNLVRYTIPQLTPPS